jgi:hypothetical protein
MWITYRLYEESRGKYRTFISLSYNTTLKKHRLYAYLSYKVIKIKNRMVHQNRCTSVAVVRLIGVDASENTSTIHCASETFIVNKIYNR